MARRDDDDAPWLAEAPPAPRTTVSRRSLFWTIFIVLGLATVAAVGLIMLMSKKAGGSTQGYMAADQAPVIAAEPGPYKVPPTDPAGMKIDGLDGTMYTAGEGIDAGSNIDQSLAPEAPLPRPGTAPVAGPPRELVPEGAIEPVPPAGTIPARAPPPVIPRPAPPAPAAAPVAAPVATPGPPPAKPATAPLVTLPKPVADSAKAGSVQLGAFSSEDKASAAWAALGGKYGLSGKRIIPVQSGDKTLYRLRASSADPAATCAKIKAAGDACAAVE